jgi:hypothetical protein
MHLDLGQKRLLDLSLDASEHERPEDLMKLLDDLSVLLLDFLLSHVLTALEIEPFIEVFTRCEHFRK